MKCKSPKRRALNKEEALVGALGTVKLREGSLTALLANHCPFTGGAAHGALRGGRCGVQDSGARAAPVTGDIGRVPVVSSASSIKMYRPNIKYEAASQ